MSNFYSLEDEDDAGASTSNGSQLDRSLDVARRSASTSATPVSQNGRRPDQSVNPISALLQSDDGRQGYSFQVDGGVHPSAASSSSKARRHRPPVVELREVWANERGSPVLLPWQAEAVDGLCSQIEEQMNIIDSLAADSATAEEEHVRLALVELDVERARWLLRSYLRCRLAKIERYAQFVSQDQRSRDDLSELERGYAVKFAQICSQHLHASVLDFLPESMRSLDDKAGSGASGLGDMVVRPDIEAPVFVRCNEDCGNFRFPGSDAVINFSPGSVHFVRFRTVEHLIAQGKATLL